MYRIRVRIDGRWYTHYSTVEYRDAIVEYNRAGTANAKMLIDDEGNKLHKQYTDNGFVYNPNGVSND